MWVHISQIQLMIGRIDSISVAPRHLISILWKRVRISYYGFTGIHMQEQV
jgi:hypothetical protein